MKTLGAIFPRRLPWVALCLAGALVLGLVITHRVSIGASDAAPPIDAPLRDALSGIDFVADKDMLDDLLNGDAAAGLVLIARDADNDVDPGLRIRAYRALSHYPEAIPALFEAVDEHASTLVITGVEVIYAKTAMASLAVVAIQSSSQDQQLALGKLGNAIEHPLSDIRAAAARALGKTANLDAVDLLTGRLTTETSELVRESIKRALLELGAAQ